MTCTAVALKSEMSAFYGGSMQRYPHNFNRGFIYSEGVKTVAMLAQASWLLDIVARKFVPHYASAYDAGIAGTGIIRLTVPSRFDDGARVVLSMSLDDGEPDSYAEELSALDFPEGTWIFYLGRDRLADGSLLTTMIIPEEYQ